MSTKPLTTEILFSESVTPPSLDEDDDRLEKLTSLSSETFSSINSLTLFPGQVAREVKEYNLAIAKTIRDHVLQFLQNADLSAEVFHRFDEDHYVRNPISVENPEDSSGWQVLVLNWLKDQVTPIHGHPQFAIYGIIHGQIRNELFKVLDEEQKLLKKVGDKIYSPGDALFSVGKPGTNSNFIHRITALSDTVNTLHIYSDNASNGAHFDPPEWTIVS